MHFRLESAILFKANNCGYNQYLPSNNQALMGMGRKGANTYDTQTYIDQVLPYLYYPAFSFALCDANGMMYLGGYPAANVSQAPFFTPMATPEASSYLSVGMLSLSVGKKNIGATLNDFGFSIMDSGTSGLTLPTPVYQLVVQAIDQAAPGLTSIFAQGQCQRMPAGTTLEQVDAAAPPLTLGFYDGQNPQLQNNLQVSATNSYLQVKYDSDNAMYLCPLLANGGSETILGNTIMRNHMVIFDLENQQVGIAPSQGICPPYA